MLTALRPVGEPVVRSSRTWQPPDGVAVQYFQSGTAALAAVLRGYVSRADVAGAPEVLVPAYTCPDVISAVAFAGAKAVLVDFEADRPWLSLDALQEALSPQTVALVGVNFQGIDERLPELRAWSGRAQLPLVYDHCQSFPPTDLARQSSDALVFSHGRGKPACALVGGATWIPAGSRHAALRLPTERAESVSGLKVFAYNRVIRPWLYSLLLKIPGLGIGETRFHELQKINGLSAQAVEQVEAAIANHLAQTDFNQRRKMYADLFARQPTWLDLPTVCGAVDVRPLLRYTVLAPEGVDRDALLAKLGRLGATRLYPCTLEKIPGVKTHLGASARVNPNAEAFARRLVTLPIHSDVKLHHVERIEQVLRGL
ncbi:MAG: DegT/DnrJ/EryC1/StrS family aminotransferase [Pseudomonadota bacterium]